MERIKFYPTTKVTYAYGLQKIETYEVPEFDLININDAIEYYNIFKYFEIGARCIDWTENDIPKYEEKSKQLYKLTLRFFNSLNDTNIIIWYNTIEISYIEDFWQLFDNCKLYKKISNEIFSSLIEQEHISPNHLFKYKSIVSTYGLSLRDYILKNTHCLRIVLHVYDQGYTNGEKLYLPKEFTGDDICRYLEKCINSDSININELDRIYYMQYSKEFPVTDEIRLAAKRKHKIKFEEMGRSGIKTEFGIELSLDNDQIEERKISSDDNIWKVTISNQWLIDSLDYPSILNNFIYLFEYCDLTSRCILVSRQNESGIFESIIDRGSSREYLCNQSFDMKNGFAKLCMNMYYSFLYKNDIRLEDVLSWFYTKYLQEEFGCPEIRIAFPSKTSTYSEKCASIIMAFEGILRQFDHFARNKSIDFELISMSTKPIVFKEINSLIDDKYYYATGQDYKSITHMLFSDQCMLCRTKKYREKYSCFYELLCNEKLFKNDFEEYNISSLDYLCQNNIIEFNQDGEMFIKDKIKLDLYLDLYQNEVICVKHYPDQYRMKIKELVKQGCGKLKSSLLSEPEANYFNFLLNRSEYCNGKEIRNKYMHGIQQVNDNENDHIENYFLLLRILIILTIKINDEFCLFDENLQYPIL